MNTPPQDFNKSLNNDDSTSSFEKSSKKKVKFDKSVDIQQLSFDKQKKHQQRINAELEEKLFNERIEQLQIDEHFRKINGIPFGGNFGSPVPMDPFQKNAEALNFGNASPTFNFQQPFNCENSDFNSSIVNTSSPCFTSSKTFYNSKSSHISGSYKMKSTIHRSSHYNTPPSKNNFSTSKRFNNSKSQFNNSVTVQSSCNFNSSRSSSMFRSSFRSSKNSNDGFNDSYKSAICHEYRNTKQCSRGNSCRYAHGYDELRPPTHSRTTCKYFLQNIECPFNEKCKFLHR